MINEVTVRAVDLNTVKASLDSVLGGLDVVTNESVHVGLGNRRQRLPLAFRFGSRNVRGTVITDIANRVDYRNDVGVSDTTT